MAMKWVSSSTATNKASISDHLKCVAPAFQGSLGDVGGTGATNAPALRGVMPERCLINAGDQTMFVLICSSDCCYFGRNSTCSMLSTIRSAIDTLAVSAPAAALASSSATWRQFRLSRRSFGTWRINSRTSASVTRSTMVGIVSGRGGGRDQLGRGHRLLPCSASYLRYGRMRHGRIRATDSDEQ